MCKLFVAVALLAIVYAHPAPPSTEEVKAELVAAGVSSEGADGIVAVGEKYKSQLEAAKDDREAAKKIFEEIKTDTDAYVKDLSPADQTAYTAFVEKKKAEFEAHHEQNHSD